MPGATDPRSTATPSAVLDLAAQLSNEGQARKIDHYNTGWQLLPHLLKSLHLRSGMDSSQFHL